MPAGKQDNKMPRHCLRAEFAPESFDAEGLEVDVVVYAGAAVPRGGFFSEPYDLQLSLEDGAVDLGRMNAGAAVLDTHSDYSLADQIGAVVPGSARIEDGKLQARIRFLDHESNSRTIAGVQQGIIRHISVGAAVLKTEVTKREGMRDLHLATQWEPHEVSLVPVPADAGAHVLKAEHPIHADAATTAEDVPMSETTPVVDQAALRREAAEAENQRQADIRSIAAQLHIDGAHDTLKACLKDVDCDANAARIKLHDVVAARFEREATRPTARVVKDAREDLRQGAANALCHRLSVAQVEYKDGDYQHVARRTPLSAAGRHFMRHDLVDIARASLKADGYNVDGWSRHKIATTALHIARQQFRDPAIRIALQERRDGMAREALSAQGVSDFTDIAADVMFQTMISGYASEPQRWRAFAEQIEFPDTTRAVHLMELTEFGDSTTSIGELEEYPIAQLSDAEEEASASKYGRRFYLSREMVLADRVGAFAQAPAKLGRLMRRIETQLVVANFTANSGLGQTFDQDSTAWFDATHNNIGSDNGAATAARINELITLGLNQTGPTPPSGSAAKEMHILRYLYYPVTLHDTIGQIWAAQSVNNSLTNVLLPEAAALTLVPSPYLTGNPYYAVAGAGDSGLVYGWAAGAQGPTLEELEETNIDAIGWKIRDEFGTDVSHWRGAAYNAGA